MGSAWATLLPGHEEPSKMKLRVLTWNIHKAIGGLDRRYSLERVLSVLNATNPDVALLQEVADGWSRAGGEHQVERLAENTALEHFAFSPEHRFSSGGYGNAVLSRFPIVGSERIDLQIGWHKKRSALMACLALPAGSPSSDFFATSLHLGLLEGERRRQLKRLFEAESHHSPAAPSVLGGDFNDVFGSLEGAFMRERGFVRMTERRPTFPAALPFFSLDAIFGHGLRRVSCERETSPEAKRASDHLPLWCEVELANQGAQT